jgi:hypothetical protein
MAQAIRCDRLFEDHNVHYVRNTFLHQMEKSEQRFVINFFDLKSLGFKVIHTELTAVLGLITYSLRQIRKWHARFRAGEVFCKDQSRPERPSLISRRRSMISSGNIILQ